MLRFKAGVAVGLAFLLPALGVTFNIADSFGSGSNPRASLIAGEFKGADGAGYMRKIDNKQKELRMVTVLHLLKLLHFPQ